MAKFDGNIDVNATPNLAFVIGVITTVATWLGLALSGAPNSFLIGLGVGVVTGIATFVSRLISILVTAGAVIFAILVLMGRGA
jgi:hypothetical protein